MTYRSASLCAGYGGLDLGLTLAGVDHQPVWYSELHELTDNKGKTRPNPAEPLMRIHHGIPNLGDLTQIVDPPKVDIVTAGFPCQPFSTAGKRKGTEDVRWLIDDVCRVASDAGARWLILENVRGIFTANDGNAMARVCQAMAHSGFGRWEWGTIRASDVGACHQRDRWFCVARHISGRSSTDTGRARLFADTDSEGRERSIGPVSEGRAGVMFAGSYLPTPAASDGSRGPDLARFDRDTSGGMDLTTTIERLLPTPTASNPNEGEDPSEFDARQRRMPERWGDYAAGIARHERVLGRPTPDPTVDGKVSPRFVEWMQMVPEGHVTDHITNRRQALFVLGNGVVPLQAATELRQLAEAIS